MIQKEGIVQVIDNSGAKTAKCIGFRGRGVGRMAGLGDTIVVSIKKCSNLSKSKKKKLFSGGKKAMSESKKVVKGEVCLAVVVQVRQPTRRTGGERVVFNKSAVVLVNDKGTPRGTRVVGSVSAECDNLKILSLATRIG